MIDQTRGEIEVEIQMKIDGQIDKQIDRKRQITDRFLAQMKVLLIETGNIGEKSDLECTGWGKERWEIKQEVEVGISVAHLCR